MNKFVKLFGVLMITAASLMAGLSNNYQDRHNDISISDLLPVASADDETSRGWIQGCYPCSVGVAFMCIPVYDGRNEGCFNQPCGGGYC